MPCLYVTHNVGEALALAERLVLLRDGPVEAQGPPRDLLGAPGGGARGRGGIENLFPGRVAAHDAERGVTRVTLDSGLAVTVPLAIDRTPGSAVTLAIRAEDVLVAAEPVRGISARNVYQARVAAVERTGVDVTLRCALTEQKPESLWLVRVTPAAVEDLALTVGATVWLAVKSHSIRFV